MPRLRETLLAAGEDLGLAEIGYYALNALRLEKSFGIWSREFTQGYTPARPASIASSPSTRATSSAARRR